MPYISGSQVVVVKWEIMKYTKIGPRHPILRYVVYLKKDVLF